MIAITVGAVRERERERVTFLNNKNVVTKVVALFVMSIKKLLKD